MVLYMNVAFTPYFKTNPYQQLLAASLGERGARVVGAKRIRDIRRLDPQIVHVHWQHKLVAAPSWTGTLVKGARWACYLAGLKKKGKRLVWTVHNLVNHERIREKEERWFARHLGRWADEIIVHGVAARTRVAEAYEIDPSRIHVIPHATYAGYYENRVSRDVARQRLGIDAGSFVFLFFGQLRRYKGLTELVRSFARAGLSDARLLIAGRSRGDKWKSELHQLCRNSEAITLDDRFIPDDEVQCYMNAADAVVLPYQDVLTSGAGVLAMSFAKAMILPGLECVTDFADTQGSILYDPADPEGMMHAMESILSADTLAMGEHNYDRVRTVTWDDVATLTARVYSRETCAG